MEEMNNVKNRNFIMEKHYNVSDGCGSMQLNMDVMRLTSINARLSIIANTRSIKLYVFCRTNDSAVHQLCDELGFVEF